MSNWMTLLYVVGAALLAFFAYRTVKNNPTLFSRENMSNSIFTMGVLTLILIVFIAGLVFFVADGILV